MLTKGTLDKVGGTSPYCKGGERRVIERGYSKFSQWVDLDFFCAKEECDKVGCSEKMGITYFHPN